MPVAATSATQLFQSVAPEHSLRDMLASLQITPPIAREPREHRLAEPVVIPLPPRAVLDTPDW